MNHSSDPEDASAAALYHLKSFLRRLVRVTVLDGRIFIGSFAGTDKPLNILLINSEEYRLDGSNNGGDGRYVGQVLVPWRFVVKVEAQGINGDSYPYV
ncbi:hypothetical protein BD779DRAFT_1560311 [Infundibulicybe gibba]|nr:hypothetical protein BD779DRAFT_1560311 [Infundibulicybe gibba]